MLYKMGDELAKQKISNKSYCYRLITQSYEDLKNTKVHCARKITEISRDAGRKRNESKKEYKSKSKKK